MSEHEQQAGSGETLAEIMAWHGMARYADPDVLEAYVRPAAPRSDAAPPDEDPGSARMVRSPR